MEEFIDMVNNVVSNYNPDERSRIIEIQEQVHSGQRNNLINTLRDDGSLYWMLAN